MTATLTKSTSPGPSADQPENKTAILAIILASYLMIILDGSVVITALPDIQRDLGFSATGLSWVQNAYTLTFGGLLLLGARAGDILGRRRMFLTGIALFTAASLIGGLAQSPTWLLAARVVQGLGAAISAPATLSLLMVSFREGEERTKALAAYSAVAGGGASLGLVLGGLLTTTVSWRLGMFITVPVGAAMLWLVPRHLPETERTPGRFDLAGAISSTLGMTSLVYGFVRAGADGWADRGTLASFAAAIVLLTGFVINERYAEQPITPLRLFASRERSGAYVARVLVVSGMFSMFFFLSQFMQGVKGFTALQAGIAFLPMTGVLFAMVQVLPRLVARFGNMRLLLGGLTVALVGMIWMSQISMDTAYFPGIAVPMMLLGAGMGVAFVPLTGAGMAGVAPHDAGAASGLVNVAHQLGGALGVGALVAVYAAAARDASDHVAAGASAAFAARYELAEGVGAALTGSVILFTLAIGVVLVVMRPASVRAERAIAAAERETVFQAEIAS